MIKKDLVNKKVVRAIALGLSAVMLTTPMTALAAEKADVDSTGAGGDDDITLPAETTLEVAEDAATEAALVTGNADDAATTVIATTDEVIGAIASSEEGMSADDDAIFDAYNAKDGLASVIDKDNESQEKITGDGIIDDNNPKSVAGVQEELRVAANADDTADAAIESADTAVDAMNATAASAAGTMSDAQTDVDNKIAEIEGATSSAAAEKGYVELQDIVDKAEADYAAAETEYNNAKDAYDKAVAEVDAAKAAYDQAIANATDDVDDALAQLEAAEEKAEALEKAAKTAGDNLEKNSMALEIKRLQEEVAKDTSPNWSGDLDDLFAYILEYYYLPTEVGASNIQLDKEKSWTKDSADYSRNFFTVKYTDADGKEVTKYLNDKLSNKADGLIIFEKVDEDLYTYKGADGKVVKLNKAAYDKLVAKKDSPVVTVTGDDDDISNDITVVKISEGVEDVKVSEKDTDAEKVEITNEKTTYSLDENGNLVETVTGTVTTTTYQAGASLTAETKETDDLAKVAAEQKATELRNAGEEDVVIADEATVTTEGYVIEGGYYIPTFTKEIDISVTLGNADVDGNTWGDTTSPVSDSEIQAAINEKAQKAISDFVRKNSNNFYFFNNYADVDIALGTNDVVEDQETHKEWFSEKKTIDTIFGPVEYDHWYQDDVTTYWDEYTRTATAKISVTYAVIKTGEKTYSNVADFLDFKNDQKAELIASTEAEIASTGGMLLDFESWDMKYCKATYKYLEGTKIADTMYESAEDAQEALDSIKGVVTKGQITEKNSYAYDITYTNVTVGEPQENQTISTTTYKASKVDVLENQHTSNANYDKYIKSNKKDISGIDFFEHNADGTMNKKLKAFIDAAGEKLADYRQIQADAKEAKEAADAAWEKVEVLKKALAEASKSGYDAELATLAGQLEWAELNWQAAQGAYKVIQDKASEMEKEIDSIIDGLKAAEDAASAGGEDFGDDGDDDTTGGTTPTTPVVVPVVTPEEIPTATVTPVAGAGAGAGAAVVDIEDEETPLAAGIDDGNGVGDATGGDGEEVLVAGVEGDETAIVAIEDEETPLAAGSGADGKMSWWWLLIVALLGATGYKMYKEHQKKKEEAAQEA